MDLQTSNTPEGYAKLAAFMGAHPETAILRRFGTLNMQNLLYLQAELINLENALHKQAKEDFESGHPERSIYASDWETLRDSTTEKDGNPAQWNLMLQIRERLKEYNQALCLQRKIANMDPPNQQDFKFLDVWKTLPSMGNVMLIGDDSDVWEKFDPLELVCLRPRQNDSHLVSFLSTKVVEPYHDLVGHFFKKPDSSDIHKRTVHYSQAAITRFSAAVGTVVASMLLVGSVVVLYSLKSMEMRLLAIGLFTAGFSLGLCLLTNGRMVEIFSATAAFVAVQVVFVGTNGADSPA